MRRDGGKSQLSGRSDEDKKMKIALRRQACKTQMAPLRIARRRASPSEVLNLVAERYVAVLKARSILHADGLRCKLTMVHETNLPQGKLIFSYNDAVRFFGRRWRALKEDIGSHEVLDAIHEQAVQATFAILDHVMKPLHGERPDLGIAHFDLGVCPLVQPFWGADLDDEQYYRIDSVLSGVYLTHGRYFEPPSEAMLEGIDAFRNVLMPQSVLSKMSAAIQAAVQARLGGNRLFASSVFLHAGRKGHVLDFQMTKQEFIAMAQVLPPSGFEGLLSELVIAQIDAVKHDEFQTGLPPLPVRHAVMVGLPQAEASTFPVSIYVGMETRTAKLPELVAALRKRIAL